MPPYIQCPGGGPTEDDRRRYQTVFAERPGSVAAPTAGLHFTEELLAAIRSRGVRVCSVTLHVGLATFAPVKSEAIDAHILHEERYDVTEETARVVNCAVESGDRVVAVGTTVVRVWRAWRRCTGGGWFPGADARGFSFIRPFRFGSWAGW